MHSRLTALALSMCAAPLVLGCGSPESSDPSSAAESSTLSASKIKKCPPGTTLVCDDPDMIGCYCSVDPPPPPPPPPCLASPPDAIVRWGIANTQTWASTATTHYATTACGAFIVEAKSSVLDPPNHAMIRDVAQRDPSLPVGHDPASTPAECATIHVRVEVWGATDDLSVPWRLLGSDERQGKWVGYCQAFADASSTALDFPSPDISRVRWVASAYRLDGDSGLVRAPEKIAVDASF